MLKSHRLTVDLAEIRLDWRGLEVSGAHGVGVKSVDIVRNTKGESIWLGRS